MSSPVVSIIIRTYNRATRIERALQSALAQDLPEAECQIIVIDDGSTDNTREIVARYPRIEYYYQENQGISGSRFAALPLAKGEFLAYLDSDDQWDTDYLTQSLALLREHNVDLVFSNHRRLFDYEHDPEASSLEGSALLWPFFEKDPQGAHVLSAESLRAIYIRHMPAPSSATVMRASLVPHSWQGTVRTSDDWMTVLDMIFRHNISGAFWACPRWIKWCQRDSIADGAHDHIYQTACRTNDRLVMLRNYAQFMTPEEIRLMKDDIIDANFSTGYRLSNERQLLASWQHYARAFRQRPSPQVPIAAGKALLKKIVPAKF